MLQCTDKNGGSATVDLTRLFELFPELAAAFAGLIWETQHQLTYSSFRQLYDSVSAFCDYLEACRDTLPEAIAELSYEFLTLYQDHLERSRDRVGKPYADATLKARYAAIASRFRELHELRPELFGPQFLVPANRFHRRGRSPEAHDQLIALTDLQQIVQAAEREYDAMREAATRARDTLDPVAGGALLREYLDAHSKGWRWRAVGNRAAAQVTAALRRFRTGELRHVPAGTPLTIPSLAREAGLYASTIRRRREVADLVQAGTVEGLAKLEAMGAERADPAVAHEALRERLRSFVPLSIDDFLPVLVLLYARTAMNVYTILGLIRSCLRDTELKLGDTALRFVAIEKARSGSRRYQEVSFPHGQRHGVIELIEFLRWWTEPLVPLASPQDRQRLILYPRQGVEKAYVGPVANSQEIGCRGGPLERFRERHRLPRFTLEQLRPTIATLVYLQTGDIFRVQRLLNHASVLTTLEYIRGPLAQLEARKALRDGIETMTAQVLGSGSASAHPGTSEAALSAEVAAGRMEGDTAATCRTTMTRTLVGHCTNPKASPQPGEVQGQICSQLRKCLRCENCWILSEDLPRVLRFRDALAAERAVMRERDWEHINGPDLLIIAAILKRFPEEAVREAEQVARQLPALAW